MHWFVLPSSNWALSTSTTSTGGNGGGGGRLNPTIPWGERPVDYTTVLEDEKKPTTMQVVMWTVGSGVVV